MRALVSVVIAAVVALSTTLVAQWPSYPTPNVPRNADGTPNLTAPTPRTADGKVDFTGIWGGGGGGGGRGRGGAGGRGGRGGDAPPAPPPANQPVTPPLATFFDVGSNLEGRGAPMTEWAAALKKQRMADNMKDNPDAHCLPIGHMQLHLHPQPAKYLQTPSELVMIWEANYGLRHIYLDGRPSPDNDPQPWWYGYTIGRWEGDTLVATTTNIRDGMWLDVNGTPLTESGKIIERFRRPNFGNLEIDITFEDPKAFTKPFTVRVNRRIMVDTDLIEFICNENEQSSKRFLE
jgi:hypothetical protein